MEREGIGMLEPAATKIGMPMEEFIRLYDTEGPFELIDGERIPKMPNVAGHDESSRATFVALHLFTKERQLGEVMMESPFVLSYTSNWVTSSRIPDVMYFTQDRVTAYKRANPDNKLKPCILVPDLVVEVVSPSDNFIELDEKVDRYLLDGVQAVWVVDPQRKKVFLHTLTSRGPFTKQVTALESNDTLTGGEIIPGFEIAVATIFE
jgi:Uma2 family endonuclease